MLCIKNNAYTLRNLINIDLNSVHDINSLQAKTTSEMINRFNHLNLRHIEELNFVFSSLMFAIHKNTTSAIKMHSKSNLLQTIKTHSEQSNLTPYNHHVSVIIHQVSRHKNLANDVQILSFSRTFKTYYKFVRKHH